MYLCTSRPYLPKHISSHCKICKCICIMQYNDNPEMGSLIKMFKIDIKRELSWCPLGKVAFREMHERQTHFASCLRRRRLPGSPALSGLFI